MTDSTAMLPGWLCEKLAVKVVPVALTLSGRTLLEDDSEAMDEVLSEMRAGATLATSAPSPGELATAFEEAREAGADEVLSIHAGTFYSSTLVAARLAAAMVDVRVEVMDSGHASFALGCCVWRAAELLRSGGSSEHAEAMVEMTSTSLRSAFTAAQVGAGVTSGAGVPLLASGHRGMSPIGQVHDLDEALEAFADHVAQHPAERLRVGVGDAGAGREGEALAARLRALPNVAELVRYRCGPSVVALTGMGTFGAVFHPL